MLRINEIKPCIVSTVVLEPQINTITRTAVSKYDMTWPWFSVGIDIVLKGFFHYEGGMDVASMETIGSLTL